MAVRGDLSDSLTALNRSLRVFVEGGQTQAQGYGKALLAQQALWMGDPATARTLSDRGWELAHHQRLERDFIRRARTGSGGAGF